MRALRRHPEYLHSMMESLAPKLAQHGHSTRPAEHEVHTVTEANCGKLSTRVIHGPELGIEAERSIGDTDASISFERCEGVPCPTAHRSPSERSIPGAPRSGAPRSAERRSHKGRLLISRLLRKGTAPPAPVAGE